MRGVSMLPLLHEPMILQLRCYSGAPQLGEVLVFNQNETFVAHRFITTMRDGSIVCAGDAMHGKYDVIKPGQIIGTVNAVWSDARDDARRIDGPVHRLRGFLVAARRIASVRLRQAYRTSSSGLQRLNPRRRQRAYVALFNALAAILQDDASFLRRSLVAVDPGALFRLASQHLCGPVLIDGIEHLGVCDALPIEILSALRKERWSTAAQTRALRCQLDEVIAACNNVDTVPILLKGAARLFGAERDSDRHNSDDIDVLLPGDRIAAVTTALHNLGYSEKPGTIAKYEPLHHTAPLFPKAGGVPLELHRVLAAPGEMRVETDYLRFSEKARLIEEGGQRVLLLDNFASALHSLIHAREATPLRNLVILACQMRRLTPCETDALYAVADREKLQRHRLHAALYAASLLCGLAPHATSAAKRVFEWRLRRYDLPHALSIRSDSIEWSIAASGAAFNRIFSGLLPYESDREKADRQPLRTIRYAAKLPVKVAIVAFTAIFALALPELPPVREASRMERSFRVP
jgi:hypothetical protein